MALRPETHRESTLLRREALLRAAVEVIAERGVGGATHRAIAERAELPLATTSYFFSSIDELVQEALRGIAERLIARLEPVMRTIREEELRPNEIIDRVVAALLESSEEEVIAQFELYLDVARNPESRPEVEQILALLEQGAREALAAAGALRPEEGARAMVALADGFALQRIVRPRGSDDVRALGDAIRAVFLASALDDDERAAWEAHFAHRKQRPSPR